VNVNSCSQILLGAGPPASEIEFRLAGGLQPLILVPAVVNGVGPLPFILDTGAGPCLLAPALARRAGIEITGREEAAGAGGPMAIELGTAGTVTLASQEVSNVPVAVTDELARIGQAIGVAVEGGLGFGFLRHFRLTIDYGRRRLSLERPGEGAGPLRAGEVVFRLAADEKPLVLVPVRMAGEGPFSFAVDTGASTTVVSPELARQLGIRGARVAKVTGGGGRLSGLSGRTGPVGVGSAEVEEMDVVVGPFLTPLSEVVGTKLDGILGYNFLRRFRVTLDYPSARLGLMPVEGPSSER
jgi:predicted aspartyl protease